LQSFVKILSANSAVKLFGGLLYFPRVVQNICNPDIAFEAYGIYNGEIDRVFNGLLFKGEIKFFKCQLQQYRQSQAFIWISRHTPTSTNQGLLSFCQIYRYNLGQRLSHNARFRWKR